MTREEAINILKSGSTFAYDEKEAGEFCEAYDMAIKALQAQDVDAVSRQAVMWMLTNLSYTQCRTQGEVEVIGLAKTMLIAMPSAQEVNNSNQEVNNSTATQPNGIESQVSYRQVTGKLDITDCISRQAAINAIENTDCELPPYAWDELTDAIMRVPPAQPEIIHCEECKYRKDNFMGDWCTCWCGWTSLDGYCHKGANKDE